MGLRGLEIPRSYFRSQPSTLSFQGRFGHGAQPRVGQEPSNRRRFGGKSGRFAERQEGGQSLAEGRKPHASGHLGFLFSKIRVLTHIFKG